MQRPAKLTTYVVLASVLHAFLVLQTIWLSLLLGQALNRRLPDSELIVSGFNVDLARVEFTCCNPGNWFRDDVCEFSQLAAAALFDTRQLTSSTMANPNNRSSTYL